MTPTNPTPEQEPDQVITIGDCECGNVISARHFDAPCPECGTFHYAKIAVTPLRALQAERRRREEVERERDALIEERDNPPRAYTGGNAYVHLSALEQQKARAEQAEKERDDARAQLAERYPPAPGWDTSSKFERAATDSMLERAEKAEARLSQAEQALQEIADGGPYFVTEGDEIVEVDAAHIARAALHDSKGEGDG